jgi:5-methylcytosine-specific restriction endonuclease McrBC GTP-binding regulatory subunit McrB
MSVDKLIKLADKFSISDETITQSENDRLAFIQKFPLEKLKDLKIDEFVLGTDENSFCYWLEFKKIGFGIGGGNASKFGIYRTKNKEETVYATGYGKNKTYLNNQAAEAYFSDLIRNILNALDYTSSEKIDQIRALEIPMWNMVLQKILGIYYPDKFLTIGSPAVLIKCAKELELKNIELSNDNSILINYECKKAISNIPQFSKWPYEKVGNFVWEIFDGEDEKGKRQKSKQYWLYAPGENAHLWDQFYKDGIMGLGWNKIGDLAQFKSRDEIKKALASAYGDNGSKRNDVSANDDFLNKIKIGDTIIVKKGRGELLGYGIVQSDYEYDNNRTDYNKIRKVDWKLKGNWKVDFNLVLKTLTDITKYGSEDPEYDTYYEKLIGIMTAGNSNNELKEIPLEAKVLYAYLKSYLSHRKIQSEILEEEAPTRGGGFLAVGILHRYDIQADTKGILKKTPFNLEFESATGNYLEALKLLKENYPEFSTAYIKNNQMNFPLNTILFGPPGTGKTYNTINQALELCGEDLNGLSRSSIKDLFKKRVDEGRIVFCTFHQSMTYEDFVEGIKPVEPTNDGDNVIYRVEDGIFKKLCKRVLNSEKVKTTSKSNFSSFDELYSAFIQKLKEIISELDENEVHFFPSRRSNVKLINIETNNISTCGESANSDETITKEKLKRIYDKFSTPEEIKSIVKDLREVGTDIGWTTNYYAVFKALKDFENGAKATAAERKNLPYVLIIDEINRGNVSQIFGELITLIEEDKRLGNPESIQVQLPYSKDWFGVPPNVYIIGTMNTADRSVEALDTALRRRFSFTEMPPKPELIKNEGKAENGIINGTELSALLETINMRIEKLLDKDHMIGHSYFLSVEGIKDLKSAFQNKIVPLLQEYFFGDYGKIGLVIGSKFFNIKVEKVDEDFFAPFEDYDSSPLVERKVYHLKNIQDMSDEQFIEALNNLQRRNK